VRPTRAEIHIDHFTHNLEFVRKQIGERPKIMAIIKANAYGHGLEIIARASLKSEEVDAFGVATEEEGCKLRNLTRKPILVLTGALWHEIDIFLSNQLDFTLTDVPTLEKIAERARALGTRARVHLKIDTGMRRIGVEPEDAIPTMRRIVELSNDIEFAGVSTHFATSDELDQTFMKRQLDIFTRVIREAKQAGITMPQIHCANSGAILQCPRETAFDMVRPGIMLYGYTPSLDLNERYGPSLMPPLELVSSVVYRKRVHAGEGVSYNLRWKAPRETTICTVPIGYGDGYPRLLTNRAFAIVRGKKYPVVGTICMDQVLVDVGDDDIQTGERATFLEASNTAQGSPAINAWSLAKEIGTIPYEILTNIAARVPRVAV
jgi:alanine racemase